MTRTWGTRPPQTRVSENRAYRFARNTSDAGCGHNHSHCLLFELRCRLDPQTHLMRTATAEPGIEPIGATTSATLPFGAAPAGAPYRQQFSQPEPPATFLETIILGLDREEGNARAIDGTETPIKRWRLFRIEVLSIAFLPGFQAASPPPCPVFQWTALASPPQ